MATPATHDDFGTTAGCGTRAPNGGAPARRAGRAATWARSLVGTLHVLLLVLGVGGCAPPPNPLEEFEAASQRDARSRLEGPGYVLYSPLDADQSASYARVLGEEIALVSALVEAPAGPSIRAYLVPLPADVQEDRADILAEVLPSAGGYQAGASARGVFFVYVRPASPEIGAVVRAEFARATIRHELVHVLSRRVGLPGASWFQEGLAEEVASMRVVGGELVAHPYPAELVVARRAMQPGALEDLLGWRLHDGRPLADRQRCYARSLAWLRFLLERQPETALLGKLQAIAAQQPESLLRLEPEWTAWLARQDPLAAIRSRVGTAGGAEAAGWLPTLAAAGAPELATRAADELALQLLADAHTVEPASRFLLMFRAAELRAEDLRALAAAGDPVRELCALALHARRGEAIDRGRAGTVWTMLPAEQRDRLRLLGLMLGVRR